MLQRKSPACRAFSIDVYFASMSRGSDQRLDIVTVLLRVFGHLLFLRRHHRFLLGVSVRIM
jgi:hypothetical protein